MPDELPAQPRYRYARISSIETPAQGCLAQARAWKQTAWRGVKDLRARLREASPLNGNRGQLRLDLLRAESAHSEAQAAERQALQAIEARANELGLTTLRARATPA